MNKNEVYVILAAYNEATHISAVVHGVKRQGFSHIIVVDDGSRDHTVDLAVRAGATVLHHMINLGKGAAMKTGAEYALRQGAKAMIFMDSDGQHKPEELPLFVRQLEKGFDIVFGARKRTKHMPLFRRVGNWIITKTVHLFYRMDLTDVTSGYRAMTAKAYRCVRWTSRDYSVESEMIARAGKNNLKHTEFTIATIYHDKYKGMSVFDGLRIVFRLIWWRMTH
jgi:glycosyltransferase involved in cell wall biosynthesis